MENNNIINEDILSGNDTLPDKEDNIVLNSECNEISNEKEQDLFNGNIKPIIKTVVKKTYTKKDTVTALLCTVPAYMFIRYVFWQPYTMYSMIFNLVVLAIVLIYIKASKGKLKPSHVLLFILSFIFNLTFILSDNSMPKVLAGIFSFGLTSYTVFLAASGREAFERGFVSIFFSAVLFIPFRGFEDAPNAALSIFKGMKKPKRIGQIGAGILIAVPLTLIVGSLLISADDGFGKMLEKIFEKFNITEIFNFFVRFMFSLPVMFFLFGMLYVNYSGNNKLKISQHKIQGIFPPYMMFSAITPVCGLYILFFIIQLNYFISAFKGVLPKNFSYSQYARQGFFELCIVVVINIVILIIMNTLCKKENEKKHTGIRVYSGLIAFFTIVLIITAISKMVMYINEYGLSPLRVYTSWFMLLLMLVFIAVIIFGFILKSNVYKPVFAVFTVMFGILCFADIDGFIAKYNIEMYKSGQVRELDVDLFYDLSDSAVKYAAELKNDPKYAAEIRDYLDYKYLCLSDSEWYEWDIRTAEAQNVVFKIGMYSNGETLDRWYENII